MFSIFKPDAAAISAFIDSESRLAFTYAPQGCTRGPSPAAPHGFSMDQDHVALGKGAATFEKAKAALRQWRMFALPWVELFHPEAKIAEGTTVAVLIWSLGLWSLNSARIVYLIDEKGTVDRYGFAYGTLPGHAAKGEERFSVEWNHADDTVWYDRFAHSQPNHILMRLGQPIARRVQKQFGAGSNLAMVEAVK